MGETNRSDLVLGGEEEEREVRVCVLGIELDSKRSKCSAARHVVETWFRGPQQTNRREGD